MMRRASEGYGMALCGWVGCRAGSYDGPGWVLRRTAGWAQGRVPAGSRNRRDRGDGGTMRGAWHGGGRVARVGVTTALRPDGVQQRGAHGSASGSGIRRYCQLTGGPCPAPISSAPATDAYVSVIHPPLRMYPRPCLCPRPRRCRCPRLPLVPSLSRPRE